jgi:hypothetical protein
LETKIKIEVPSLETHAVTITRNHRKVARDFALLFIQNPTDALREVIHYVSKSAPVHKTSKTSFVIIRRNLPVKEILTE